MTDSTIRITPQSSGPYVRTNVQTIGGVETHTQAIVIGASSGEQFCSPNSAGQLPVAISAPLSLSGPITVNSGAVVRVTEPFSLSGPVQIGSGQGVRLITPLGSYTAVHSSGVLPVAIVEIATNGALLPIGALTQTHSYNASGYYVATKVTHAGSDYMKTVTRSNALVLAESPWALQ